MSAASLQMFKLWIGPVPVWKHSIPSDFKLSTLDKQYCRQTKQNNNTGRATFIVHLIECGLVTESDIPAKGDAIDWVA